MGKTTYVDAAHFFLFFARIVETRVLTFARLFNFILWLFFFPVNVRIETFLVAYVSVRLLMCLQLFEFFSLLRWHICSVNPDFKMYIWKRKKNAVGHHFSKQKNGETHFSFERHAFFRNFTSGRRSFFIKNIIFFFVVLTSSKVLRRNNSFQKVMCIEHMFPVFMHLCLRIWAVENEFSAVFNLSSNEATKTNRIFVCTPFIDE